MADREQYFLEYAKTHKEQRKEYRKNNKDKIQEYYQKNKTKIRLEQKEWKQRNKEKIKQYTKEYNQKNKEKRKLVNKEYFRKHPETQLRSKIKGLKKLAIPFKLPSKKYWYALICWSKEVKNRDKKCIICGSTDRLEAHHIIYKKYKPQLSLNVTNGITLCKKHHDETHGKGLHN